MQVFIYLFFYFIFFKINSVQHLAAGILYYFSVNRVSVTQRYLFNFLWTREDLNVRE